MEYLRTIYRHKAALFWMAGIGFIAAIIISSLQPRMFQSRASIQVQGLNENFLNLRDIYPTAAPAADNLVYIQTQAELLQEEALIQQVVRNLRLADRREFDSGTDLRHGFWPWAGSSPPVSADSRATQKIKQQLQVLTSRGSSIIHIVVEDRSPQLSAAIANTLAETFIDQTIQARQKAAEQTRASLGNELDELRLEIFQADTQRDGSPWMRAHSVLKLDPDGDRQFYAFLAQKVREAAIASSIRQSNIRLVGRAQPAAHPSKPNIPLNLAIGVFGGLLFAIGYVSFREQTSFLLHTPGEAGKYLTVPELGAIPRAGGSRLAVLGFGNGAGTVPVERAALEQPFSFVSESIRATLASILSAGSNGDHPRTLIVTSACPMEGKTTVVSNLGIALAEIGQRVLLIDGDLRRSRLHQVFQQSNNWGLSDILREQNAIEDLPLEALAKRTGIPHLYLLPSGTCTDNIFGLMCSARMARLLPRFRGEFDYVLVDAPPCLEFADARIMARYSEKLLLVLRADYTDRRTAQAALQRLFLDGTPVMGVIFNCWDPSYSYLYSDERYRQDPA